MHLYVNYTKLIPKSKCSGLSLSLCWNCSNLASRSIPPLQSMHSFKTCICLCMKYYKLSSQVDMFNLIIKIALNVLIIFSRNTIPSQDMNVFKHFYYVIILISIKYMGIADKQLRYTYTKHLHKHMIFDPGI